MFVDLPLLPLSNGEFTTFNSSPTSAHLYISSDSHPASVLPMISNKFIDVSNSIDDDIIKHLKAMARKGNSRILLLLYLVSCVYSVLSGVSGVVVLSFNYYKSITCVMNAVYLLFFVAESVLGCTC